MEIITKNRNCISYRDQKIMGSPNWMDISTSQFLYLLLNIAQEIA